MWAKRDMVRERHRWEEDIDLEEKVAMPPSPEPGLQTEESQAPRIPETLKGETGKQTPNGQTGPHRERDPVSEAADTRVESELQKEDSATLKGEGL